MINGRVLVSGREMAAGFCLTDRVVATAAHAIRGCGPGDLTFLTASGALVEVERVETDPETDVAILRVARSLAIVPVLAEVTARMDWTVPIHDNPQLSGTVTAVDHMIRNAGGFDVCVLQLHVHEELRDFRGYSGSAVTVGGAVVGILVEQVPERDRTVDGVRRFANVLYAVPILTIVEQFRLRATVLPALAGLPVQQQLLDTAYFDLDALKSAILDAKARAAGRLLGFAVASPETVVVRKLCDWLPAYLGELECKDWINLNPAVTSPALAVKSVERYAADLSRVNVVCPVLADGVPAEVVARFWDGVSAHSGQTEHWLVLLISGAAGAYPPAVTMLPRPSFTRTDVAAWTRELVALRRWPARLAQAWTELLVDQSSDGDELNVRFTYEALQDSIRQVRQEPDVLRRRLEERSPR